MLKSVRTTFALLALGTALAVHAWAQETPKPQESPWAMRAPAAVPQGVATRSPQEVAALEKAERGTPEQQQLAREIVDAMFLKDPAAMKQLIAPSIVKCIGKNQDFLNDRIKKQFDLPISRNYHLTIVKLPPNVMNASPYATYPMPPTHLMAIEFSTPDGGKATVNETIGQEDGRWYESQPCPTELGMQRFAKIQHMRVVAHERAKAALAQVKEPLKSQLLGYVAKHDNVSAWKLCMSSLKMDFATCRGVVAILAGKDD
jgi:hypothetical protein